MRIEKKMTEIKSTLELALEKANKLSITSEDKKRAKIEEYTKKINDLLTRFFDQRIQSNEFEKALETLHDADNDVFQNIFFTSLADYLQLENENEKVFEVLKIFDNSIDDSLYVDIKTLIEGYKRELENKVDIFKGKMLSELEKEGIKGTAIIPNVNEDYGFIEAKNNLKSMRERDLGILKKKFIESASRQE